MRVEWFGQSAFMLEEGGRAVAVDPFGDLAALRDRGLKFEYPPVRDLAAELLLITHEHGDHNHVESVAGDPVIIRSTAGRLPSPVGEVVAIASEHDDQAGTARGPNTIFVFELGGHRVCHFGDFGQSSLREEQAEAMGEVDLLMIPVGGGPTIGARDAVSITRRLSPRWVVPMHYRTPRIGFLETAEEFLAGFEHVHRGERSSIDIDELPTVEGPLAVVPAAP
jgi:L-ascorbate metabolism protein UlaG (beta-lactamase superfamily)